jgi:hypothetical protein
MKNNYFSEVLLARALAFKHAPVNDSIIDIAIEQSQLPQMKQVCAKLSEGLSDEIDSVCGVLDISKRKFIEMALMNAISEFNQVADEYDIFEPHTPKEDSKDA